MSRRPQAGRWAASTSSAHGGDGGLAALLDEWLAQLGGRRGELVLRRQPRGRRLERDDALGGRRVGRGELEAARHAPRRMPPRGERARLAPRQRAEGGVTAERRCESCAREGGRGRRRRRRRRRGRVEGPHGGRGDRRPRAPPEGTRKSGRRGHARTHEERAPRSAAPSAVEASQGISRHLEASQGISRHLGGAHRGRRRRPSAGPAPWRESSGRPGATRRGRRMRVQVRGAARRTRPPR